METRARYVVIGLFVLAVTLGSFGFVYWLKSAGGLGQRALYRVEFQDSVSGLSRGSSVLFNGLRIGEVSDLRLDPARPKVVIATAAVDPDVAIRADTTVDIDFQGLAGAPAISLKGGTAGAPLLRATDGKPPLLIAPPGVGQSLTQSARETLRSIDRVIADNEKPLNTTITSISTFAQMLARNSQRLEEVIGGLERLTGGGTPKEGPKVYDLTAPTQFPALAGTPQLQLVVPDPVAILAYDTQKILTRTADGEYASLENAQWSDTLPKLVQAKVVQSFENAGLLKSVSRPFDDLNADHRLVLEIRSFQLAAGRPASADVEIAVRLIGKDGKVIQATMFHSRVPVDNTTPATVVAALNTAFGQVAREVVAWTVKQI